MTQNKRLLQFNIKNVKYALPDASGSYENAPIKPLGGSASLTIEANYNEQEIYADGRVAYVIATDRGLDATLEIVDLNIDYEIDMGRKMRLTNGIADIEQKKNLQHAIYFEADGMYDDGERFTIKTWMYNVTSGKPNETYNQDTDAGINPQNYSYSLNILGTILMDANGQMPYIDEKGNTLKVWKYTSYPGDEGYEDFDKSVPVPKVAE